MSGPPIPPPLTVGQGTIVAGQAGAIVSKFTFRSLWGDPISAVPISIAFNFNSDVAIPSFHTTQPLTMRYNPTKGQPHGFKAFDGIIGAGRIYITIDDLDIVISGPIEGGPESGQSFVGSGTWTAS